MDTEIVRGQLYHQNVRKSMGPGGINLRVLKDLVDVIAEHLPNICQSSWGSGEVPTDQKLVRAIPIYKKGMRN